MGKLAGLTVVGLVAAIALDGLYAKLMDRPWGIGQAPEVLRVSVPGESEAAAPVSFPLEALEQPGEDTIHLLWTEPGNPDQPSGQLQGSSNSLRDRPASIAFPVDCETADSGMTPRMVTQ